MVDWTSVEELKRDAVAFDKVVHVWLGIYGWEWITSLEFEWQFVMRKKKFMWPMIFYFLNRYCLLFTLIGLAIAQNVTTKIDCQALYTFNQFFGCASIGLASINLSLRTITVWSRKWYILCPIVAIILGHWSLLFHGILIKVEWVPDQGCTFTETNNTIMVAIYIYTMVFDFIIMSLTGIKLASPSSRKRTKLTQLIFQDGMIYFILAFLANAATTILMVLDLNPVMSVIAAIPAMTLSGIVACRIVRRLRNFTTDTPQIFSTPNPASSALALRSITTSQAGGYPKDSTQDGSMEGVHVKVETFRSPVAKAEYDSPAQAIDSDATFDSEAQIRFKVPPPY